MHQHKQKSSRKSVIIFSTIAFYLIFFITVDRCFSDQYEGTDFDQRVEFGSTPNPVGSGARALGMGGAFIGIADDATAASWNPAGLIQLELPEMSVVGAYNHRLDDISYESFPESSGKTDITEIDLNYLSAAYPFNLFNRNMIVSLNYQHMYTFNKKVNLSYEEEYDTYSESNVRSYDQEGKLCTISPAFALQITPSFSFGVTLNFWEDFFSDNQWKTDNTIERIGTRAGSQYSILKKYTDTYEFSGFNFHTGFLWSINNTITIGGVLKSPFKADIEHTYESCSDTKEFHNKNSETLEMPLSYGIGAGFRVSDTLSFSFDLFRTQWNDYILKTSSGESITPLTGKSEKESDIKDTTQVRLGMEYLKILKKTILPFRLGLFYDPEPAEGNPDDFFGFSTGTGFFYKKIVFDIAYQYRFGRDVRTITISESDSSQDIDQHMVYASMILHY